jgi:hypothetical protein
MPLRIITSLICLIFQDLIPANAQSYLLIKASSVENTIELAYNFNPSCITHKIAYPVNHGSMEGYHDAQPFGGKSSHLEPISME